MSRFTHSEYQAYLARQAQREAKQVPVIGTQVKREADLHNLILDECRRRGWIALHGSMASPTARTEGEPDFVILANAGRVLLVECKTKTGKLSPAQAGLHAWAARLGHVVHVARSFEEFLSVVNQPNQPCQTILIAPENT